MEEITVGHVARELASVLKQNLPISRQLREFEKLGFEELIRMMEDMDALRKYAEKKQLTQSSINVWLQQAKDVEHMLNDIFDDYLILSRRFGVSSFFNPKYIQFRHRITLRLKYLTRAVNQLAETKNQFFPIRAAEERPSQDVFEWRQTNPSIDRLIYGREGDIKRIFSFLFHDACSDFLSVYPIVGVGGIGKTTLAQLVFNHKRVSTYFVQKIWIPDCRNFSIKKILCSIIEYVISEKYDAYDLDVIERKVQELFQNKLYLLVLDDVWSHENWNRLKSVLSCGSKGSCILATTRDIRVAEIMGSHITHHLAALSENDCWELFINIAFDDGKEMCEELVEIGKGIVVKCRGSPLAAQALGGLMRYKNQVNEWREVMESWIWESQEQNPILPVLMLTYFHLTSISKQCLAFCTIFPPNTEIMKEDLIQLWMANGFVSSEDVGNETWDELYQKSFFKDVIMDDFSGDIAFKMHGHVHDLAESVMAHDCIILENVHMTKLARNTHHIGFGSDLISFNEGVFKYVESLLTLYQFEFASYNTVSGFFPTHSSLRVLSTGYFPLSSLRSLIHLRYLKLYGLEMETLPNSICSLQNLEVLKLISCLKLRCLPKRLSCLQNLRHLVINECHLLSCMFPDIRKLSCLKTLSLFIVSLKTGHSLAELKDLQLGGKLRIEGLQNVGSSPELQKANLMNKTNLHELCLSWDNNGETKSDLAVANQVLEVLQPHQNLKVLRIYDYEGLDLPRWIGNLKNLVALELFNCNNCSQLPPLGKLPYLRKLEIYSMENVQCMDDDESYDGVKVRAFPSLEELEFRGLPNLERLLKVERGEMFPLISNVTIDDCSKLHLPTLPSIKQLNARGCNHNLLCSISSFNGLTFLNLSGGEDLTSFPEGMVKNLTYLKTMIICNFPKLKELPHGLFDIEHLQSLEIRWCCELESLAKEVLEGPHSLKYIEIVFCAKLRSLPEGFQHLPLEVLKIECCPELEKRCKEGTGEDWDKIPGTSKVILL